MNKKDEKEFRGIPGAQPLTGEGKAAHEDWRKLEFTGQYERTAEKVKHAFGALFTAPVDEEMGKPLYVQTDTNPEYRSVDRAVQTYVENARALSAAMENKGARIFDVDKMPVGNQDEARNLAKPLLARMNAEVEKAFAKEYTASKQLVETREAEQRRPY